jgi:delta 1-pyrroline-5-carboxylate dehydrogenase
VPLIAETGGINAMLVNTTAAGGNACAAGRSHLTDLHGTPAFNATGRPAPACRV